MDLSEYPNLQAVMEGRASGRHIEWPGIRHELRLVLDELESLRYEKMEHDSLGCSVAKTGIYAEPTGYTASPEALERHAERLLGREIDRPRLVATAKLLRKVASSLRRNPWRDALIDALVVNFILSPENENDPRKAIQDLIAWEQKLALDPAVSQDAADLIERGRKQAGTVAAICELDGCKALRG